MRGKLMFLGGMAAGFVLGARAGREKYEQIVANMRKILDHPTVQEAAGVAQAQATRLYGEGKDKLSHSKLGEKLGYNGSGDREQAMAGVGGRSSSSTGANTNSASGSAKNNPTGGSAKSNSASGSATSGGSGGSSKSSGSGAASGA